MPGSRAPWSILIVQCRFPATNAHDGHARSNIGSNIPVRYSCYTRDAVRFTYFRYSKKSCSPAAPSWGPSHCSVLGLGRAMLGGGGFSGFLVTLMTPCEPRGTLALTPLNSSAANPDTRVMETGCSPNAWCLLGMGPQTHPIHYT